MNTEDFKSFLASSKGMAPASIRRTVCCLAMYFSWCKEQNKTFDKPSVEGFLYYLIQQNRSSNTLNAYRSSFVTYQEYLNDRGSDIHFMDKFKSYSTERATPIEVLSLEEIKLLLAAKIERHHTGQDYEYIDTTNMLLTKFLIYTGARVGGAVSLKVKDLDFAIGKARFITKRSKVMEVFLLEPLKGELQAYIKKYKTDPNEYLFCTSTGKQIMKENYLKALTRLGQAAGITKHIHPHLLRHCFTSLLRMNGADIADISKLLGHKHLSTTFLNYLQYFDSTLKKALQRHPLMREGLAPEELLQLLSVMLREFGILEDSRFNTLFEETGKGIAFKTVIRD